MSASGTGDVYLTNPLHGNPTSVTLHRLDNVSPQVLEGDNIAVTNEEAPEAESSTGDFTFSPSNTHFDEAMTYYHSDEFEAWLIGDLGMRTDQLNCQVSAETHSSQGYAFTFPGNCEAFFGDGDNSFFGNPTRERSILDHEYMHIVSETYNGLNQDTTAGALDEGYSDFFAVADRHANTGVTSARLGAYVGFDPKRTVDNNYLLSEFENGEDLTGQGGFSVHDGGVVLAGALWDFKQSINDATLAAEVTLESLDYLDSDPSFYDARNALLNAAYNTGNSQLECDIKDPFASHGIGRGCVPPPAPTGFQITNGGQGGEHPQLSWNASVSANSYDIYRLKSAEDTQFHKIGTAQGYSNTSYTDTGTRLADYSNTNPDGTVQYKVKAVNEHGSSSFSTPDAQPYDDVPVSDDVERPALAQSALQQFEARTSGPNAALEWAARPEAVSSSDFAVQHRTDSTAAWATVGRVPTADSVSTDSPAEAAYRFEADRPLDVGTHQFRLAYETKTGLERHSRIVTATIELSEAYRLRAFPNPAQGRATVALAVKEEQDVEVAVYDVLGRQVTTLYDGPVRGQETKRLSLNAPASGLSSGTYFVRVQGEGFVATERLTIVQ